MTCELRTAREGRNAVRWWCGEHLGVGEEEHGSRGARIGRAVAMHPPSPSTRTLNRKGKGADFAFANCEPQGRTHKCGEVVVRWAASGVGGEVHWGGGARVGRAGAMDPPSNPILLPFDPPALDVVKFALRTAVNCNQWTFTPLSPTTSIAPHTPHYISSNSSTLYASPPSREGPLFSPEHRSFCLRNAI